MLEQGKYDERLEDLLRKTFNIDRKRARQAAQTLTLTQFNSNFITLEAMLGWGKAAEVVKKGKFLEYRNDKLDEYIRLAREVYNRLGAPETPAIINTKFFYSLESLKEFLGIDGEKRTEIDPLKFEGLDISRYKLFHKANEQSRVYLNELIEKRKLKVEGNEHWNKGPREKGFRGRHILEKITYELQMIFNDLGLARPEFKINYGQHEVIVYGRTPELLGQIRDKAYSLQI